MKGFAGLFRRAFSSGKRVPTFLQMEAVECGAAALGSILAYYERWVTLEELRVTAGVSRDGANAGNIVKAARTYGLSATVKRLDADQVLSLTMPFIVFWNANHFVVVESASSGQVRLMDPASGPRRVSREEFKKSYSGVALEFEPGPEFKPGGSSRGTLSLLLPRVRHSKDAVSAIMLISVFLVIPGLITPAVVKSFIDDVLSRGYYDWIIPLLLGLLLAALLNGVLTFIQQLYLLRLETKLTMGISSELFWQTLRVPVSFYSQRYAGDIATRVASCHRLAELLSGPLSTNTVSLFIVIFYAFVMSLYSIPLTIIAVIAAGFNILSVRLVSRSLRDLNSNLLNKQAKLNGAAMGGLQSIETIKATGAESDFFQIWAGYQTLSVNEQQRLGRVSTLLGASPSLISHITTALVLGVGGYLIIQGYLTMGALIAFQLLMGQFTAPIQSLVGFGSQIQQIRGDLSRIQDVMDHETDPLCETPPLQGSDRTEKLSGAIELRDVGFQYGPLDPPLIENFSLKLDPGCRVALVGTSGSGKSTLAKLILGLHQPTAGEVLYDGEKITEIPRELFTASVASVDQEIFLFESTIDEEIRLWDSSIERDVIVRAARDACIHNDIASRPGGYGGQVSENGANFSGGQRQRIEIARALAKNPTICVLDEATASLDAVTEKKIDDNLRRRGLTCVIVAHRLSTVRDCDEIIVLNRGKVVERGTHDSLMESNGRYAQLVSMQ
ncbi:MAG: NHLP family bacteriocin export ABC transporter peptidase/permease/ATPase subunit [Myxococcota bacterium]|nr:NHLP family bacteriocin export ABC transporter peptidase/permease/ATPase subunit [Myxococcota bacterium]